MTNGANYAIISHKRDVINKKWINILKGAIKITLFELYAAWVEKRDCPAYRMAEQARYPILHILPEEDADRLVSLITQTEAASYAAGFREAVQLLSGT